MVNAPEILFQEKDPLQLFDLGDLDIDNTTGNPDFDGYGYAYLPLLSLISSHSGEVITVKDSLALVVHASDEAHRSPADDIDLAFYPDNDNDDAPAYIVSLRSFLSSYLPPILSSTPRHTEPPHVLVLAVCNPNFVQLSELPLTHKTYYPVGDVAFYGLVSSHDDNDLINHIHLNNIQLEAHSWLCWNP